MPKIHLGIPGRRMWPWTGGRGSESGAEMPGSPSSNVGSSFSTTGEEIARRSAQSLMHMSGMLKAREEELESQQERVSLLSFQVDTSKKQAEAAEQAKRAMEDLAHKSEAQLRATETTLKESTRKYEARLSEEGAKWLAEHGRLKQKLVEHEHKVASIQREIDAIKKENWHLREGARISSVAATASRSALVSADLEEAKRQAEMAQEQLSVENERLHDVIKTMHTEVEAALHERDTANERLADFKAHVGTRAASMADHDRTLRSQMDDEKAQWQRQRGQLAAALQNLQAQLAEAIEAKTMADRKVFSLKEEARLGKAIFDKQLEAKVN